MTDHLEAASGRPVAQTGLTGTPTIASEQEPARVALHLLAEMLPTTSETDSLAIETVVHAGLRGDTAYLEAERERLLGARDVVTPDDTTVEGDAEAPLPPVRAAEEEIAPVATEPEERAVTVALDPEPLEKPNVAPKAKRPAKPKGGS